MGYSQNVCIGKQHLPNFVEGELELGHNSPGSRKERTNSFGVGRIPLGLGRIGQNSFGVGRIPLGLGRIRQNSFGRWAGTDRFPLEFGRIR